MRPATRPTRSFASTAACTDVTGSLTDRKVIITGGGSGMGAALTRAFPALGADVVSLDIDEESGRLTARESDASFVRCDVSSKESGDEAFAAAVKLLGGLDVLIHAAGIAPASPAAETDVAVWNQVMAVNATGTFLTNVAAFAHLRDSGGRIINFASGAGVKGYPLKAAYAASKGASLAWMRSIAVEWAPFGITVNAIAPAIWTPMYDRTRASMSPEALLQHDQTMSRTVPLGGKLGDAVTDLVPVLEFLAGDGARFMTGQVFPVDGGLLMMR
ncbi:SDR family oxidoreductase [Aeromicrobium yanjiei]|uniref:SDR family oxidoreductase n=1 Tax=Aeromicrobium yanjiei TaxID=2662028 RepID=A0A5Q2MKJ6_9ACTN|nr:SDR family oxidoreductase [Aeromicrobium yanjiei]